LKSHLGGNAKTDSSAKPPPLRDFQSRAPRVEGSNVGGGVAVARIPRPCEVDLARVSKNVLAIDGAVGGACAVQGAERRAQPLENTITR
jgi:hypothetical protein